MILDYNIIKHPISKELMKNFKRKCPKKQVYLDRLVEEFDIIIKKNFHHHLLLVVDFLKVIGNIPHIIRGSSGSSLVCFCLGITSVDPVEKNICFERFLNEKRDSMPDIDMDFPHNLRNKVFDKLNDKYPNQIARISNHIKYKEKSALRQAIRFYGYNKHIPKKVNLKKIFPNNYEEITPKILEKQKELIGTFRCYSLHCGGIIYCPEGIPKDLLIKSKNKNQIKYNKDDVDEKDFFKIDILSNRGLAHLLDIDKRDLNLYPEDNDESYKITKLFSKGKNIGITFAESPAMRKILSQVKPKNTLDVAFCLALVRPAAAVDEKSETLVNFSKNHLNNNIVYDDDAILYIKDLLNCDGSKADYIRKGFSKNKFHKIKYFNTILENCNYKEEDIRKINKKLSGLRKYSFCKSHSLSYAQLVWALAYQKIHQPKKFWLSHLNHCNSSYKKFVHINEAKKSGLSITLGKKPWILKNDTLISQNNYNYKHLNTPEKQFLELGFWKDVNFLPNMFLKVEKTLTKKGHFCLFRGLIATGKLYKNKTFVTISHQNARYLDLYLNKKSTFYYFHGIEGQGYIRGYLSIKPPLNTNALRIDVTSYNYFNIKSN